MNIWIPAIAALGLTLADWLLIGYYLDGKASLPHSGKRIVCYAAVAVSLTGLMLMLVLFYKYEWLFTLKHLLVLAFLWPLAVEDYRHMRIPNKLILGAFLLRLLLIPVELLVSVDAAVDALVSAGMALVLMAVICLVCMLISKGSLGMGDMKMLLVMAVFLGLEGVFWAMFLSVFVTFVVAIVLLLTKKKGRRDALPFAPFVLIGTFISFILTGT